ncbi:MAG TPA: hypothetical protein VGG29_17970 [Caulobacteraceae bacterium]|jgi:hypothetical protein
MDANGNLTDLSEFDGSRRIRLVSYMDENLAVGGFGGGLGGWYKLGIHHLSAGNPDQTLFLANGAGPGAFSLAWVAAPGNYVSWEGQGSDGALLLEPLAANNDPHPVGQDGDRIPLPQFTVDFVDGPWFALNDTRKDNVFDCSGSGQDEGNPIIPYHWNGGDNQRWRAATRGPGLG